jgi:hypothetical protein
MTDHALSEQDLFMGKPLPEAELVIGEDFYDSDRDANDSTYRDVGDPISHAIGTPGYMADFTVTECRPDYGEGIAEAEVFDRYYFPPQEEGYDGPAPILIDILRGGQPDELEEERQSKHCAFKAEWCAGRLIRYAVLTDLQDMMLTGEQLRAKIVGEEPQPTVHEAPAKGEHKRGVQHPRAEG